MLPWLLLAGLTFSLLFGLVATRSGGLAAWTALAARTVVVLSLVSAGVLFLLHPGWDTNGDLPAVHGRGAIIAVIIQLFVSMGPKPTGAVLLATGLLLTRGLRAQMAAVQAGDYAGIDELEARAEALKEYRALVAKALALTEANKAALAATVSSSRVYANEAEARAAATELNRQYAERHVEARDLLSVAQKLKERHKLG